MQHYISEAPEASDADDIRNHIASLESQAR
jgi:hypothetical protein